MSIGSRIAKARSSRGLTQGELAEMMDVTFQAVSTWERDENLPDTSHLTALAKALNVSLDSLLLETENPGWELNTPAFNPEHMYTYVRTRAQAANLTQTLAALPLMREKHKGQVRKGMLENVPYSTHPLTLACHALAMGLADDDVLAAALLHDVIEDTPTRPEELPVSDRVREAVCLVSYNTYECEKDDIKPLYYENIQKNPLAALIKCIDRCNNLSCMADGFDRPKMRKYVLQTEKYVLPLLDVIRDVPAYNNAAWLLRYQITTLLETFKRLL